MSNSRALECLLYRIFKFFIYLPSLSSVCLLSLSVLNGSFSFTSRCLSFGILSPFLSLSLLHICVKNEVSVPKFSLIPLLFSFPPPQVTTLLLWRTSKRSKRKRGLFLSLTSFSINWPCICQGKAANFADWCSLSLSLSLSLAFTLSLSLSPHTLSFPSHFLSHSLIPSLPLSLISHSPIFLLLSLLPSTLL